MPQSLQELRTYIAPILTLTVVAFGFFGRTNGAAFKLEAPVAICRMSSDIFVLDTWGTVYRLRQLKNALVAQGRFSLEGSPRPIDMACVSSPGQESLVVTEYQFGRGSVVRYGLDGKIQQNWNLRSLPSGVDFNPSDHSVYLSTSDSNEIYKIDPTVRNDQPLYLAEVSQARKLGPLVVDSAKNVIYVADGVQGAIFACSISTKKCKGFVTGLGAPTALYLDQTKARLYIADAARSAIFTASANQTNQVAVIFVSSPLKSPSGVVLIPGSELAVSDYKANSVYVFSGDKTLLSKFP